MDLAKYRGLFVDGASEHLAAMSRSLVALGGPPEAAREAIDTLFRGAHSIKGMAASLEYEGIASLAHRLEDRLEPARREGSALTRPEIALLGTALDALQGMVAALEAGRSVPPPPADLLERLAAPAEPAREGGLQKKARACAPRRCRAPCACAARWSIAS